MRWRSWAVISAMLVLLGFATVAAVTFVVARSAATRGVAGREEIEREQAAVRRNLQQIGQAMRNDHASHPDVLQQEREEAMRNPDQATRAAKDSPKDQPSAKP